MPIQRVDPTKFFFEYAIDRAIKEANPDYEGLQRLYRRGGEFQSYLAQGIKRFTAKALDYELAKSILGKDFITPEEIAAATGVSYTDEQLGAFEESLPDEESLNWCHDNDMMLIAGPQRAMSLSEIHTQKSDIFYSEIGDEERAQFDEIEPGIWIAFSKGPARGSLGLYWLEQLALVKKPMTIANIAEAAWALATHTAVRGVCLLEGRSVRTSSINSDGISVMLIDLDPGICFDVIPGHPSSILGIMTLRKFPIWTN